MKGGIFMELLGHRANVKPFISVFIWGLVTTVTRPLLAQHWALKTGWAVGSLGWLLAAAVGNRFCNLIIIAIFGAIKSSIFPLMAFTSCHIHALVLIPSTGWGGKGEGKEEREDSRKLEMECMEVGGRWGEREGERGQQREGGRETDRMRRAFCVCAD